MANSVRQVSSGRSCRLPVAGPRTKRRTTACRTPRAARRRTPGLLPAAASQAPASLHRRDDELGAFLGACRPARGDGLRLRVEADRVRPVLVQVAEAGALPAAER